MKSWGAMKLIRSGCAAAATLTLQRMGTIDAFQRNHPPERPADLPRNYLGEPLAPQISRDFRRMVTGPEKSRPPGTFILVFLKVFSNTLLNLQIVSVLQCSSINGHEARITVPFPLADSMAKEPRESSTRSLMLVSPNPCLVLSCEITFSTLNP